jgi:hypothetical protein
VLVCGARGSERAVISRRLAASADMVLRSLAIYMDPLAVLGTPYVFDEQRVESCGKLGAETEQSHHPYREVSDKRPAPFMGASRTRSSHRRRATILASHLQRGCILDSRGLPCLAGPDTAWSHGSSVRGTWVTESGAHVVVERRLNRSGAWWPVGCCPPRRAAPHDTIDSPRRERHERREQQ